MKFLRQFSVILAATAAGELARMFIPLPVPAGIYGMLILLFLLMFRVVRVDQVQDAGAFLIETMPIMFIGPTTLLMNCWTQVRAFIVPFLTITLCSTVIVFGLTGKATDFLIDRRSRKEGERRG